MMRSPEEIEAGTAEVRKALLDGDEAIADYPESVAPMWGRVQWPNPLRTPRWAS